MTLTPHAVIADVPSPLMGPLADQYVSPPDIFSDVMDRDGIRDPSSRVDAQPLQGPPDPTSPIPGGGELLEEPDDAKVFKAVDDGVMSQRRLRRNREETAKHWNRIKNGQPFCYLRKLEDQSVVESVMAPGVIERQQPVPNKVLDLCQKQVSQILIDPPLPNPKADGDQDKNRGVSDLGSRFLRADGDASGTNDADLWRELLMLNRTWGSAFVYQWVDPTAGGWRPKQRYAHPMATDATHPLMGPVLDPTSNQPVTGPDGQPLMERAVSPVLRYVGSSQGADGSSAESFVPGPAEAAREWLPKHRRKTLKPTEVCMHPPLATAHMAEGMTLILHEPLSEARRRFPLLATLADEDLKSVCDWRPKRWKSMVSEAELAREAEGNRPGKKISDDTLVFWYLRMFRIGPDYPDGAMIAVNGASLGRGVDGDSGAGVVLDRDTLRDDVELDDGTTVPVLRNMPLAQFRAMVDVDGGDGFGLAPVSLFGGANAIRSHLYLATLQDIDYRLNINTFVTSTSTLTRADLNRRDNTPLEVLTKDDMPTFEERPQLPASVNGMIERIENDMNVMANLNQAAQALDSSMSASGEAKKVAIAQARVQLAQDWQGFINGCQDYWLQKLQLAQARLTISQKVKIGGENNAFHADHFVGADLIGITAVSLMPNTGTMMSPTEKAQFVQLAQNNKWIQPDEGAEVVRSSMSDDLGIAPSPHEQRIDRCLSDWCEGPPEGWVAGYRANQQLPQRQQAYQQQMTQLVQQTEAAFVARGIPQQAAQAHAAQFAAQRMGPAPEAQVLQNPFEPRPNDAEPTVALVYAGKLSRFISTPDYSEQPPEWRTLVDTAYNTYRMAAGLKTLAEQMQATQMMEQFKGMVEVTAKEQLRAQDAKPGWNQLQTLVEKAVNKRLVALASAEVTAISESDSVAQKPTPVPVPEQTGPGIGDATHPADMAHESAMSAQKHVQNLREIKAKAAAQVLSHAAAPAPAPAVPTPSGA